MTELDKRTRELRIAKRVVKILMRTDEPASRQRILEMVNDEIHEGIGLQVRGEDTGQGRLHD